MDHSDSELKSSTEWRQHGNASFKRFIDTSDKSKQRSALESALVSYNKSVELAANDDEKSSAFKNYATAAWRLAKVLKKLREQPYLIEFRFREAISNFSKASICGHDCKPVSWLDELAVSYSNCISSATEAVRNYPYNHRIVALEKYIQVMSEDSQKAECFLEMATIMSHAGYAAISSKDFRKALQALHDCHRPVQECLRLTGGKGNIFKEASIIDTDLIFHLASAEALKAIKNGDDALKNAVENDEDLNMDLVYDAIDLYHNAIVLTREIEVEVEAIACSRLGNVFDKTLKMKLRAKEYFTMSIHLAASLSPRNFGTQSWYKMCMEALQRYQAETMQREDLKHAAERSAALAELVNELKDLNQAAVGSFPDGFMRHIYKTYPPKNSQHVLNETGLKKGSRKKTLMKAILHFHPDKQDSVHGVKWQVLCEEITKRLNSYYEESKGGDELWEEKMAQRADDAQKKQNKTKDSKSEPKKDEGDSKKGSNNDEDQKKDSDNSDSSGDGDIYSDGSDDDVESESEDEVEEEEEEEEEEEQEEEAEVEEEEEAEAEEEVEVEEEEAEEDFSDDGCFTFIDDPDDEDYQCDSDEDDDEDDDD